MSTLCCPNCQWQALEPLPQNHYFKCTKCLREWFILEWTDEMDWLPEQPLLVSDQVDQQPPIKIAPDRNGKVKEVQS